MMSTSLRLVWRSQVLVSGRGARVTTAEGRELLDFTSGIGVTSTGHCHPRVVAAVQAQAAQACHLQMSIAYHDRMLELVERLEPYALGLDRFFFATSGAEAVEGALRLARQATGRSGVIAFQGGYHGRTAGTLAVTTSGVGPRAERGASRRRRASRPLCRRVRRTGDGFDAGRLPRRRRGAAAVLPPRGYSAHESRRRRG